MAIPRVSKMITDRQRQCEFVDSFVVNHREALVAALTQLFEQDLEEGQQAPDVVVYVDALVRRLRRAFRELVEAEHRHLDEISNDGIHRDRRDEAAKELRAVLFHWRDAFRLAFGERIAEETGFEARIAEHPLALLRQTQRILQRLKDAGFVLPAPAEGVGADRDVAIRKLEPPVQQLRESMDALTDELTKAHGTKISKDKAMEHFDEVYRIFVNLLQPAFRLAGEPELAERLALRLARRPDSPEPTEENVTETPTDPPSSVAPAEQP